MDNTIAGDEEETEEEEDEEVPRPRPPCTSMTGDGVSESADLRTIVSTVAIGISIPFE